LAIHQILLKSIGEGEGGVLQYVRILSEALPKPLMRFAQMFKGNSSKLFCMYLNAI